MGHIWVYGPFWHLYMCVYQLYKVLYSDNLPKVPICNLQLIISIRPSVIREKLSPTTPLIGSCKCGHYPCLHIHFKFVYSQVMSIICNLQSILRSWMWESLIQSNKSRIHEISGQVFPGPIWLSVPYENEDGNVVWLAELRDVWCGFSVWTKGICISKRGRKREREGRGEKREMAFSTTMMTYVGNDARALNAVAESLTLFRISSPAHAVPFFYAIALIESSLSLSMEAQIRVHSLRVISPINVYS